MRIKLLMLVLVAAIMMPVAASALHFTYITPSADCYGWAADFGFRWRQFPEASYAGTVSFTITLEDSDGNVLDTFTWSDSITRPDPSYFVQHYSFGDAWTVTEPAGVYFVHGEFSLEAPTPDGMDANTTSFEMQFECETVPTQETSWSSVKSLFE